MTFFTENKDQKDKKIKFKIYKKIHSGDSYDLVQIKLQVHFINYLIGLANDAVKSFFEGKKVNIEFKKIAYSEKKDVFTKEKIKETSFKDIFYLSLSKKNLTHAKKILEDNQVKPVSMLNIIKKDIYEQKMKALEKFKYIKENMKGDLKINLIKFVRKPPNKLNNIRDYTRQREQFKKYQDFDPVDHSDDEEEKDYLNIYPDFVKKNKMLLNQKNRISNLILKINKKPL